MCSKYISEDTAENFDLNRQAPISTTITSPSPKRKEYRYLWAIVKLTGTAMCAVAWPRLTWAFDIYGGDDDHFPVRR
jgi:hypothetical protein